MAQLPQPGQGNPEHWQYAHLRAIEQSLQAIIQAVNMIPGLDEARRKLLEEALARLS